MDWREALDVVVGRTGHGRFRSLCADDHPDRMIWRSRMIERATGEAAPIVDAASTPPANPTLAEDMRLIREAKACAFRSRGPGCGCSGHRCALRGGAIVSHLDCIPCVRTYGA